MSTQTWNVMCSNMSRTWVWKYIQTHQKYTSIYNTNKKKYFGSKTIVNCLKFIIQPHVCLFFHNTSYTHANGEFFKVSLENTCIIHSTGWQYSYFFRNFFRNSLKKILLTRYLLGGEHKKKIFILYITVSDDLSFF